MFLRSDYFDAPAAARRIVRHFEQKLELFGVEKLTKNITQADISQDTLDCLYHGFGQMLPVRDRAGREVLIMNPSAAPEGSAVEDKVDEFLTWLLACLLVPFSQLTPVLLPIDASILVFDNEHITGRRNTKKWNGSH